MSIYVILGTPGAFDFQAFSESTQRSLALLAPVIELRNSDSKFASDIAAEALQYVQAVKLGVGAAQRGFTATEDIISLAGLMGSSTPEERAAYLVGTLELADQAFSEGKQAYEVFRDVRTKIYTLTDKFSSILQNARDPPSRFTSRAKEDAMRRSIDELRRGIDVLEAFGSQASALAQWWDWIKVETEVHRKKQSAVVFDDSSLRQEIVINRWKLLRTQFADYTNMVTQLEDMYPDLLSNNLAAKSPAPNQRSRPKFRSDLQRVLSAWRSHDEPRSSSVCCLVM